jgi:hypothetical protein
VGVKFLKGMSFFQKIFRLPHYWEEKRGFVGF